MALFGSFICKETGLPCPHAEWGGVCSQNHCIMQSDDELIGFDDCIFDDLMGDEDEE